MGLIRKALVLGGLFLALPTPPAPKQADGSQPVPETSTFAAIEAAMATVADVRGFCARQPQACVTGQYLVYSIESKVKYGTRLAYDWAGPKTKIQDTEQTSLTKPAMPQKSTVPQLRTATLNDTKPTKIEDLLRATQD
jgi:Family of unknown function (DUF5330)